MSLQKSFLIFALIAVLVTFGQTQRVVPGSCPTIQTEDSFDALRFYGSWVETEKTPSIFDFVLRCMEVEYANDKGGSMSVAMKGVSLGGLPINIAGDGVIHDPNRNGHYNVRYVFGVPFQGTLMTVVDTDYTEYAVLYSCINSLLPGVFHTEYVWILTRHGVLSNPSRQNIYTKLDSLKINRNQLQLSDRSGCPAISSNAPAREEKPSIALSSMPIGSASIPIVPLIKSQTSSSSSSASIVPIVKSAAVSELKPISIESNNLREEDHAPTDAPSS